MGDSRPPSGDPDFDAGVLAFEHGDWRAVIEHTEAVIARRPWHDEARYLTGFAWRRLGDHERALAAYDRAPALNPHNRGALEYLGGACLELDRPDDALALLARLEEACRRAYGDIWRTDCEEWADLKSAHDAYRAARPPSGRP